MVKLELLTDTEHASSNMNMVLCSSVSLPGAVNAPSKRKYGLFDDKGLSLVGDFKLPKLDADCQFPHVPRPNEKENKLGVGIRGKLNLEAEEHKPHVCASLLGLSELQKNVSGPDNQALVPNLEAEKHKLHPWASLLGLSELQKYVTGQDVQVPISAVPKEYPPLESPSMHPLTNKNPKKEIEALVDSPFDGDGGHFIGSKKSGNGDTVNINSCCVESVMSTRTEDETNTQSVKGSSCTRKSAVSGPDFSNGKCAVDPTWVVDDELTDARKSIHREHIKETTSYGVKPQVNAAGRGIGGSKYLHNNTCIGDTSKENTSEDQIQIKDNGSTDYGKFVPKLHCKTKEKTSYGAGPELEFQVRNPEANLSGERSKFLPKTSSRLKEKNSDGASVKKLVERTTDFNLGTHCAKEKAGIVSSLDQSADCNRRKVVEALDLFRDTVLNLLASKDVPNLLEQEEVQRKERIYKKAAMFLKKHDQWVNVEEKILGAVPGVEIGDRFHFRAEMVIVGLHRQFISGIDVTERSGQTIATSIVDSGRYANNMISSDVLIYSGQGGNPSVGGDKHAEDQKLTGRNLALKNSMLQKTEVRVIFSFSDKETDYFEGKYNKKNSKVYIYDGLYYVVRLWQERGEFGKLVYKFELKRAEGQARANHRYKAPCQRANKLIGSNTHKANKSSSCKTQKGVCLSDVSIGNEKVAIPAVNTFDREKPPPFNYVSKVKYPKLNHMLVLCGCNCVGGCSDSNVCACAKKNGGGFPFNPRGATLGLHRPLVYECGRFCKCPSSCPNRVSQHGIRFPLEIFKTKSYKWGVRSRAYIPAGSFVCEYVGEVKAISENRTGKDDYLFDIGRDEFCSHSQLTRFTLDAGWMGNVGRFINHSCSPNLYVQEVLYDHEDKRMPHVMLFTTKNIAPKRELTYDHNHKLDGVWVGNENLKRRNCDCKSKECINASK